MRINFNIALVAMVNYTAADEVTNTSDACPGQANVGNKSMSQVFILDVYSKSTCTVRYSNIRLCADLRKSPFSITITITVQWKISITITAPELRIDFMKCNWNVIEK